MIPPFRFTHAPMTESHKALAPASEPQESATAYCANCGTELKGPFCHACGQSTKHVLKHLPALAEDALDLVFNIDGRIMHTIPALYLRPGFLTCEYFAGRRARYIPPFRLMFFLSVLAFLVIQFDVSLATRHAVITPDAIEGNTPAEVRANLQKAQDQIAAARNQPGMPEIGRQALDISERSLRAQANQRLKQLGAAPVAGAASTPAPGTLDDTMLAQRYLQSIQQAPDRTELARRLKSAKSEIDTSLKPGALTPATRRQLQSLRETLVTAAAQRKAVLSGTSPPTPPAPPASAPDSSTPSLVRLLTDPGDSTGTAADGATDQASHMHASWLPDVLNDRINAGIDRARANLRAMRMGRTEARTRALQRIIAESLSVLPQALFLMLPLFAVLLKMLYLFKRRLYIEHLMVAMYSHAFIYLSLLLWALAGLCRHVSPPWLASVLGWVEFAIFLWIPIYLLWMQKRVYGQGWFVSILKYGVLGICYSVLLSFAIGSAALIGLAA